MKAKIPGTLLALMLSFGAIELTTAPVAGQELASVLSVNARLEKLRDQHREMKAREAELRERIRRIHVDLQPENLQLAINHIASLNAGELRDQRRRQLESEKAKTQEQLASVEESRFNLEKTIIETEIEIARLKAAAATAAQRAASVSQEVTKTSEEQVTRDTVKQTKEVKRKPAPRNTRRYATR
jgi:chromosome segregation ATPase